MPPPRTPRRRDGSSVGFLPGDTLAERLALVADPPRVRPLVGEVRARINDFLRRARESPFDALADCFGR